MTALEKGCGTKIVVADDAAALAQQGAELFLQEAIHWSDLHGQFTCAVSGGTTPRPMHRLLAGEPFASRFPWETTHLFWVDERWVPETDPYSNYGAAKTDFIDRVPLASANVHPIPTTLAHRAAASWYEGKLIKFFQKIPPQEPIFDLVFLGIGADGQYRVALSRSDPRGRRLPVGDERAGRRTGTFPGLP